LEEIKKINKELIRIGKRLHLLKPATPTKTRHLAIRETNSTICRNSKSVVFYECIQ